MILNLYMMNSLLFFSTDVLSFLCLIALFYSVCKVRTFICLMGTMGSDSHTLLTNDRSRTYWTPTMERYFIDLMLDHMNKGNISGHTFNKPAWTEMLDVFNAHFESQYDKDILKSRYTNLWKQFNDVKNLLGQNGFSWDEARQMVVADDFKWDAYVKVICFARLHF